MGITVVEDSSSSLSSNDNISIGSMCDVQGRVSCDISGEFYDVSPGADPVIALPWCHQHSLRRQFACDEVQGQHHLWSVMSCRAPWDIAVSSSCSRTLTYLSRSITTSKAPCHTVCNSSDLVPRGMLKVKSHRSYSWWTKALRVHSGGIVLWVDSHSAQDAFQHTTLELKLKTPVVHSWRVKALKGAFQVSVVFRPFHMSPVYHMQHL